MQHDGKDRLDLLTVGRAGIDLYGEQIGGRLEDMGSFAKYIGGSPTNTAIGVARLGLKTGLLSRVGADHMGRFIREELHREGVDTSGVAIDPDRLTALVMLGIRSPDAFPLIFFRENCADIALDETDVDPTLIARADAILINGTHLSQPLPFAASYKAAALAKQQGCKVVFDVDYRPVLWGLAPKDMGEDRFVAHAETTGALQRVLPLCDLIVGTEEEIHILGGSTETIAALRAIRERSTALIVCKLGAAGCVAFEQEIPDRIDQGLMVPGFPIDVFNVLGAGDSFMAGLVCGWLKGLPVAECCRMANACGALVVSRHGCAPAMPTWDELQLFLSRDDWPFRLREASLLEQVHWATTRHVQHDRLNVLAIDHRSQFEDLAAELGIADTARVPRFKQLALEAVEEVARGAPAFGVLLDGRFGARALEAAADLPHWIGRPIEFPGSCPLEFEGGPDVAVTLRDWPLGHVVKCLVFYHPDDPAELRAAQDAQLRRLFDACRATRHELLLEVIASKNGTVGEDTIARVIRHIYSLGIYPDWWKLEPQSNEAAWDRISEAVRAGDPYCRGILMLGLAATAGELESAFRGAARSDLVKGFAVGRTIFHEVASRWLVGAIDDDQATQALAANFRELIAAWDSARSRSLEIVH